MLRFIPPVIVLAIAFAVCWALFVTKPEHPRMPQQESLPKVRVKDLRPVSYQVRLHSQGTVQARTESTLVSEVRGKVISVSPAFRAGGFFEKGELLLEIDSRDYETAVVVAEASLAQAQLNLVEEQARSRQAEVDWRRLQPDEEPSGLVLRMPQLKEAEANIASAKARLQNAKLNLERTKIVAPYAGRILSKEVDIGQYVSTGNILASVYAVDYAEIRLPLSERQLAFLDFPEAYRGSEIESGKQPKVTLVSTIGNDSYEWEGRVVRAEGAFDTRSRQLFVIAQVDNPYSKQSDGRPPLKVGSFVQATIQGKSLQDVFVIPRELYRKNEYVVIIGRDDRLTRRSIQVEWSDQENLIVKSGIQAGERICLTPLRFPSEGMRVEVLPDSDSLAEEGSELQERGNLDS